MTEMILLSVHFSNVSLTLSKLTEGSSYNRVKRWNNRSPFKMHGILGNFLSEMRLKHTLREQRHVVFPRAARTK